MRKITKSRKMHIAALSLITVLALFLLPAVKVKASSVQPPTLTGAATGRNPAHLNVGDIIHTGDLFTSPNEGIWQFFYLDSDHTTIAHADIGADYAVENQGGTDVWEVIEIYVSGDFTAIDLYPYKPKPAPQPDPKPEPEPASEEHSTCHHDYEWEVVIEATATTSGLKYYKCRNCKNVAQTLETSGYSVFFEDTVRAIENAAQGGTVTVETELWESFGQAVIDALGKRPDVTLTINYRYQGKYYTTTIPAGSDLSGLINEDGYCGFRYLDKIFGGSEITR